MAADQSPLRRGRRSGRRLVHLREGACPACGAARGREGKGKESGEQEGRGGEGRAGRRGPSSPERRALVWSRWPGLGLPPPGGESRGAHGQARGWGDAPRCAHPPPALNAPGQPSEEPRAPASAGEAPERQDLARAGDAVVETELPDARGTHFPLRSALESCQPGKASRRPRRFREVMVLALGSGGGIRTSPRRAADSQQVCREPGWP